MSNYNGVIIYIDTSTDPDTGVSFADVQTVLGTNADTEIGLCTHENINKWARYKPERHNGPMPVSYSSRKANNFGLEVPFCNEYGANVMNFMVYNFGAAILRSKGDTRTPLYILCVAGLINVGVSMLTVIVFRLSVVGVALATLIANAFSSCVIVWLLHREKGIFRLRVRHIYIYRQELKRILAIGLPAGLQTMVFSFSNIFVQSSINKFGYAAIAGASLSVTFDAYCYYLLSAFCAAAITFTGQNYGAGQIDRCRRIFRICLLLGGAAIFIGNMLFVVFEDPVTSLFTTDPKVVFYCKWRMHVALAFQWIATSYEIPAACMRGFGQSLLPAVLTIVGTCFLRLAWIFFVLPHWPGYGHLMLCYPISWIITGALVFTTYVIARRKAYAVVHA